jgi:predicted MFS family arabinose efflux permease
MFRMKWQAMIQGLAFMSHQLGSFLGAYGGGLIYDSLGSYTMPGASASRSALPAA